MKLSIKKKMILMCLMLLIIPGLIIGTIAFYISKQELNTLAETSLKNDVNFALKMINIAQEKVESGELTLEEAQEAVKVQLLGEKGKDGKRSITKDIDIGENGYLYVVDDQGTLLMHPVIEGDNLYETKTAEGFYFMQDIIKKANNGGGFTKYDWALPNDPDTLAPKIVYAKKDPNWQWVVASGTYMMDFNSGANKILYILGITLLLSSIIGSIFVIIFARHIGLPIRKIAEQASKVAEGDLSVYELSVKNNDEVGQLAKAFGIMTSNLRKLLVDVNESSLLLAASSQQLSASSEHTSKATEEISNSTIQLAAGAEEQSVKMNSVKNQTVDISNMLTNIHDGIKTMQQSALKSTQSAEQGNMLVKNGMNQMNIIADNTEKMVGIANVLHEKSTEIGEILNLITAVADQTNLLALNAAIEAARAGEHGRGFAIVADEVRKLAEQSGQAASDIGELVQLIQEETRKAVETMQKGKESVLAGKEVVDQAGEAFMEISSSISSISGQSHSISEAMERMDEIMKELVESAEEITRISNDSHEYTQHVAAATEEQTAAIEEISASAESLSKLAEHLQSQIQKFKL